MKKIFLFNLFFLITVSCFSQTEIVKLWPAQVPGETEAKHPAQLYADSSRNVKRITNITDPVMTVYRPSKNANGTGILICPGGGYKYLAINIEGSEIAKWFNDLGYTAFVLEYRVPQKREGALQDLQRAIRIVRNNSEDLRLNRIGVIGFSAGGNLSGLAATNYTNQTYKPVDKIDSLSARPDFAMLIYPAYLSTPDKKQLIPAITITKNTPPVFMFGTADDQNNIPLPMAYELLEHKLPFELHIYPTGGHGYGLRTGNPAAEAWPALAEKWLNKNVLHLK
jgi:dienelactone hydrolase